MPITKVLILTIVSQLLSSQLVSCAPTLTDATSTTPQTISPIDEETTSNQQSAKKQTPGCCASGKAWQTTSTCSVGDFVTSEDELRRVLEKLERQARESISLNPDNYVDPELDIEDIIRIIEAAESTDANTDTYQVQDSEPEWSVEDKNQFVNLSVKQPIDDSQASKHVVVLDSELCKLDGCPICLEPFGQQYGDTVTLKCEHQFHKNCILSWRRKSESIQSPQGECPMCRRDVIFKR